MKIAIIGTGISGLGAAYLLRRKHDIVVYETDSRIGGHSRTIDVVGHAPQIPVDTGFIVFNKKNYPLLTKLFEELDVPIVKSDMSFGVSIEDGFLEYGSKGMFAQKANLLRPAFWRMLRDILYFNKTALRFVAQNEAMTLRECLVAMGVGDWFSKYYIQAMGAAIWSCSAQTILDFPASSFLRFFENHGLLTIDDHPQWYTVKGGSREYVKRLSESFRETIKLGCGATDVARIDDKIQVRDRQGGVTLYDHVVLACHANEALEMLTTPSRAEVDILSSFSYQQNALIVHGDESFMPKRRRCWSSWVYLSQSRDENASSVSLTYWMNQLQPLETEKPIFVTLNPHRPPRADLIYDEHVFDHPMFNLATLKAQRRFSDIQGVEGISFCGAYQRYGFHEDGFMTSVAVAQKLGVSF